MSRQKVITFSYFFSCADRYEIIYTIRRNSLVNKTLDTAYIMYVFSLFTLNSDLKERENLWFKSRALLQKKKVFVN